MGTWNDLAPTPIFPNLAQLGRAGQAIVAQRILFTKIFGLKVSFVISIRQLIVLKNRYCSTFKIKVSNIMVHTGIF